MYPLLSPRYRLFPIQMIRILPLLLIVPALAWGQSAAQAAPARVDDSQQAPGGRADMAQEPGETGAEDPNDIPLTWMDTGHSFATTQALSLAQWLDDFFGDPEYDADRAESFLRLQFVNDWDEEDGNNIKVRLRGRIQLPSLSKRVSLVFSGEDGDELTEDELSLQDQVGLRVAVKESRRSRFDATLGFTSSGLRPGLRYRLQDTFTERDSYRYTQRLQWEGDEGFYTTGQVDLNHHIDEDNNLRWSNRVVYGEESDGVEWRTRLAWRQRRDPYSKRPYALSYFGAINGVTDPSNYVRNYGLGLEFRRQIFRKFLFLEVVPSWNYRRRNFEDDRDTAWSIVLRLEVALERDLMRNNKNNGQTQ